MMESPPKLTEYDLDEILKTHKSALHSDMRPMILEWFRSGAWIMIFRDGYFDFCNYLNTRLGSVFYLPWDDDKSKLEPYSFKYEVVEMMQEKRILWVERVK